jgi:hypothetical protein
MLIRISNTLFSSYRLEKKSCSVIRCSNVNFKIRDACNKCRLPKSEAQSDELRYENFFKNHYGVFCSAESGAGSTGFLGLQDPDPLGRGMDPDPTPDPSIIKQK